GRPQAPRRPHRAHCRAAYLGISPDPEPSLMMPGIIISAIFREQGKLMFRATPVQNEFAGVEEPVNNPADGFRLQISPATFPRCTRASFFALQQPRLHQPFDRMVTDAAYSRSFAQTNSLRIRQSSFLTGNGMVAPGCRHASLIPSLPFARRIAASVQYR